MKTWFKYITFQLTLEDGYRIKRIMGKRRGGSWYVLERMTFFGWMREADSIIETGVEKRWSELLGIDIPENVGEVH